MKKLYGSILIYLYLPFVLFLFGWTRFYVAVPVALLMLAGIWKGYQALGEGTQEKFVFRKWEVLFFLFVFFALCVFAGGGDLFRQDYDWHKHHAILYDLVSYDWPVVYDNDVMLTYYLGQYLVPGLAGKIAGHSQLVARWALTIWNALGLFLTFGLICQYVKAKGFWKKLIVCLILIFWGGAVNVGQQIYQYLGHEATIGSPKWIDMYHMLVHFAPNFDAIAGAFQHVIVPWLCAAVFMKNYEKYQTYILLSLPLFFTASFGFVYFALLMISCIIYGYIHNSHSIRKRKSQITSGIFSWGNFLMLPVTAVIVVYLAGNVFGDKPAETGNGIVDYRSNPEFYLIFVCIEFLCYAVFLWKENRKNVLYYLVVAELLLIPFFKMGMYNDLCSRGSIPARLILMVLCIEQVFRYGWKNWRNFGLAVIFFFAAMNTLNEGKFILKESLSNGIGSSANICNDFQTLNGMAGNVDIREDEAYNYYTMNYSESLFYKIGRHEAEME